MMDHLLLGLAVTLSLLIFVCLYRAFAGPSAADRVVAIDVISTKVAVLIVLLSILTEQESFMDVALIYAMMGFITTIAVSKFLEKGKLY